ncbi:MAG: SDR family oxidoreductase [Paludibacteraceae bacterium]|nr:SDR family oxidoreductase [Paludibacteraceae bacterium]
MKKYLYRLWQWVWKGIPVQKINAGITTIEHGNTLAGQKILITGGSRGIGYILAKRFIAEGAAVLIVSRNEGTLQKAATELGCKCMAFDVTNIDQLPELIQKSAEALSGLTGLVNNAGVCNIDYGFLNVTEQSYDEQFLLNVKSPFFLTQAFVKYVTENKIPSSSVLFITSERGLYPDDGPYGMTKAAIGNIIAGIARRFALQGVHINGIAPGVTADTKGHPEKYDDLYLKGAVGKRYIVPEELAEVAVFLMSNASKCVSGEIIPCNQANHYK